MHLNVLSLSELWKEIKMQLSHQELLVAPSGWTTHSISNGEKLEKVLAEWPDTLPLSLLWEQLACPGEFHGYISLV